jgi:hypothetical protein
MHKQAARDYARSWVPGPDDEAEALSAPHRGQAGAELDESGRLWFTSASSRSPAGLRLTEDGELVDDDAFGEERSRAAAE